MARMYVSRVTKIIASFSLALIANTAMGTITSGTYTIGAGSDYPTLSDAITDLNSSTITGPVILTIKPGSYTGATWKAEINNISGGSNINTVTIQAQGGPGSVTISVSGSSTANYLINLNSASYVHIKDLRLINTNTTNGTVICFSGNASNDSVSGCLLKGATGSATSTARSIVRAENANSMSTNVICRDTIQNGSYGIYWFGTSNAGSNNHVFNSNHFVNNYYGYIRTSYIGSVAIDNNTFTASGTSGYHYGVYHNYPVGGFSFRNNKMNTSNSGGTLYGLYVYYGNYNMPSAPAMAVENNNILLTSTSDVYGVNFDYYCLNILFKSNIINCNTNAAYTYGFRVYYYAQNLMCVDNEITTNNNGSYSYPWYLYYVNYGNQTGTYCVIRNNISHSNNLSTSGYSYASYMYYNYNMQVDNNTFNADTRYSISNYGPLYMAFNSNARNNTFNFTNPTSGSINNYAGNVYNSSSARDTFENNTINIECTGSSSISNYACYYIPTGSVARNNIYNLSVTNGTLYNYGNYGNGGLIQNNKFNLRSTTGTIYGAYNYGSSSYVGAYWVGNTFDMTSNSGTIYGFGGYLPGQDRYISNVFVTKTSGTSYLWYESPSYGASSDQFFLNNTFHSNSTGTNDYLIYKAGGTSYSGKSFFYNNIFTSSNTSNDGVLIKDSTKFMSDHNIYYAPNTIKFQSQSNPTLNTTDFNMWKNTTNRDNNSLIYSVPYVDAAGKNFRPLATSPNAWALQGRGMHVHADTVDIDGNPRARTRQEGVPDLGAYEFTPNSIPPNCIAVPSIPVANKTQVFTFGMDTVATIAWGSTVPPIAIMKQYTGVQAGAPMPGSVDRGYMYVSLSTGGSVLYDHKPTIHYKNPWLGTISNETNTKIARSTKGGRWEGYNFNNCITDSILDRVNPVMGLDSTGSYTIVENARIGIRCVVEPTGLSVKNITAFTADLNWDPVFLPIGYQVLIDTIPGTPVSGVAALFALTNSLSVTTLKENTNYYAHIRSICGTKDTSGWATIALRTLITCHVPNVKITALTQTRAIAYWDTVQTATQYEYALTSSSTPPAFGTPIYTNSTYITPIAGKEYYVHVRAFCNDIYPNSEWGSANFMTFPTKVNNVDHGEDMITIYPNPATDKITVTVKDHKPGDMIIIIDAVGKTMYRQPINNAVTTIDTETLPTGMYVIKYVQGEIINTLKFSKL